MDRIYSIPRTILGVRKELRQAEMTRTEVRTKYMAPAPMGTDDWHSGERNIEMRSLRRSLHVCVSVREHISGTTSPMAVAQSSSRGVAKRYVLPVLPMTPIELYMLCWREHNRRKLSPTLATA